jgi:intracellular septation protein
MKLLYDFFPILLFFIAYKVWGILPATAVAIVASFVQVGLFWFKHRRFENMHLVSLGLITVLGGLTLLLADKQFIMWKPTLINWLFAAVFLGSHFIGDKPLVQRMLGGQIELPTEIWPRLSLAWVGFFLLSGAANLYFAFDYLNVEAALRAAVPTLSEAQITELDCTGLAASALSLCQSAQNAESLWVNFKLFGLLGLTVVFIVLQALYLARYMPDDDAPETADESIDRAKPARDKS